MPKFNKLPRRGAFLFSVMGCFRYFFSRNPATLFSRTNVFCAAA